MSDLQTARTSLLYILMLTRKRASTLRDYARARYVAQAGAVPAYAPKRELETIGWTHFIVFKQGFI
jgi:hypothetical protein